MKRISKKITILVFVWGYDHVHANIHVDATKDVPVVKSTPVLAIVNENTDENAGIFAGIEVSNKLTYKAIAPKNKSVKFSLIEGESISSIQWYDVQTQSFYRVDFNPKKLVNNFSIRGNGQYQLSSFGDGSEKKESGTGSVVKKWTFRSNRSR